MHPEQTSANPPLITNRFRSLPNRPCPQLYLVYPLPTVMIHKFTLTDPEQSDFKCVVEINSESTFLQLNQALLRFMGYDPHLFTIISLTDDYWEKQVDVTPMDMGGDTEVLSYVMDETVLDVILEEKQRMLFVYDLLRNKSLRMQLTSIKSGSLEEPKLVQLRGKAPMPSNEGEFSAQDLASLDVASEFLDQDLYGDSEYELDEISDGFGEYQED